MAVQKIGELNGRWSLLLKICLSVVPIVVFLVSAVAVPWSVWVTSSIYNLESEHVQYKQVCEDLKTLRIKMENMPPKDWQRRVSMLETLAQANQNDHTQIKVCLGEIKAKLGVE